MLNKKRLALSAAILGAITLPAATGTWRAAGHMSFNYNYAVWNATEALQVEETSRKRGITVDQFYAEEVERCVAAGRGNYVTCPASMHSYFGTDSPLHGMPLTFTALVHGLLAVADSLVPLILSITAGAIACAAVAWFGPGLIAGYLLWLRTPD